MAILLNAISDKGLYIRISLVGESNLPCPFCHIYGISYTEGLVNEHSLLENIKSATVLAMDY